MPAAVSSRQTSRRTLRFVAVLLIILSAVAATVVLMKHRGHQPVAAAQAKSPRIVSLLPEATDILEAMGCGDHLVAVTGFDQDPAVAALPRAGDYQTTDWETIASLHPDWIITHYGPSRTPPGFTQHAEAIGAVQLNLQTETLSGPDPTTTIYYAIEQLGKVCHEPEKAADASTRLRNKLATIQNRVANEPRVPTLIVIGVEGTMVAGRNSFLSDLLDIAGGANAAGKLNVRYPQIDREQLIAMHPEVILQLLPNASPQVLAQAKEFWQSLPEVPAVKNGRVKQLTGWYEMVPGYHVGDVAEEFAGAVHPLPDQRKP